MKQFNVVSFPADTSGCAFYRMQLAQFAVESSHPELNFSTSRRFITDVNYFNGVNLIMVMRQVSNPQETYFNKFLVPLSKAKGSWLIYNIDDCLHKDDIPKYNKAWNVYQSDELMSNIRSMLHSADFVLTTTSELKQYYIEKFDVPATNILIIPNYLSKWWIGPYYDLDKSINRYMQNRKRPRVGIISSPSHFNLNEECTEADDLDVIYDTIIETYMKYKWVMFGTPHHKLIPLIKQGLIEFHQGSKVLDYPRTIDSLNLQAIVAPLLDNTFNRCKSNIKLLEGAALGIPVIGSSLPTYAKYSNMTFANGEELKSQLSSLFLDKYQYKKVVKANYEFLDAPHPDAPKGWWIENNVDQWLALYKLRAKAVEFDFTAYMNKKKNIKKDYEVLYKNEDMEIIA